MNRKIKFGIVGFGNIGTRHAKHILQHPAAELVAVCDISPRNFAQLHSCPNVARIDDFAHLLQMSELDVINVCTPNYLHHSMTVAALKAGKHVVCEKPMAMSVAECEEMIATAECFDKKLFVVKQNRYNPPVQAVKKLIAEGKLGRIYQVAINCFWNRNDVYYQQSDWRGSLVKDGGCLYTQCSHFVDIMYYLIGNVKCVAGLVQNMGHPNLVEFEDTGSFVLQAANGAIANFNFSTCSYEKNMEGSITILAEHGTIKIGGQYLNTIEYQHIAGYHINNLGVSASCNDYGNYKGSMSNHDKVIANVVDTLHGRAAVATNGANGLQIIAIIEDMYRQANIFTNN